MKFIRFGVEGILNSFRVPFFRTYHKTFFAPPKSTIIGMLCNISLKSQKEFFEILNKESIDVSVVINSISGKAKELWSYKTLKKVNMGKSVVRRDKLFLPIYTIYLRIQDDALFKNTLEFLTNPKNIPSLGLDDELITIKNITALNSEIFVQNNTNRVNSVFLDKNIKYKVHMAKYDKFLKLPTPNLVPTKFTAFDSEGNRISKEAKEEFLQVEYINCEVEFLENIESFRDMELGNRVIFY
ncbi:MAG: CRISPR-associated protein Cas5 [Campylobacteraceae bacterium]|jgi:CRISPR-associated protein Cas5t|nr:CRISPR-associated protein Cas5 [Campylobacteraceae bacterium]